MGSGLGLLVFDAGFVQSRYSVFTVFTILEDAQIGLNILISCYLFLFPAGNSRRSLAQKYPARGQTPLLDRADVSELLLQLPSKSSDLKRPIEVLVDVATKH